MKKLTIRQMQAIERVAKNVHPLLQRKLKIMTSIDQLQEELGRINDEIKANEAGVVLVTEGLTSSDLLRRVVITTDKVDKEGKIIKKSDFVPSDRVEFNKEDNCYYIKDEVIEAPVLEGAAGSDFDLDATAINNEF